MAQRALIKLHVEIDGQEIVDDVHDVTAPSDVRPLIAESLREFAKTVEATATKRRETDKELLERALPLLQRLGDFVSNGDLDSDNPDSYGERCDLILDIKRALGVSA